jgi:hypothetical protein
MSQYVNNCLTCFIGVIEAEQEQLRVMLVKCPENKKDRIKLYKKVLKKFSEIKSWCEEVRDCECDPI